MKDNDPTFVELVQNPEFNLPLTLPDGVYTATMILDDDTDGDDGAPDPDSNTESDDDDP